MANKKFSQFANGGAIQPTDTIVGLRAGVNTKFNAPGVTGDVFGPESSVDGHLAIFDGISGKLLADGGAIPTGDVTGPGSSIDNHVALFNGPSGKVIKDGGVLPTGDVKGPGSSVNGHVAVFSGITGKIIADGGVLPTGDVEGPFSATSGNIAVFDGTTGKLIRDGGPVPITGGINVVLVSTGYVQVANNTRYILPPDTEGKTYFQTPATAPLGFYFEIWGAGGNPLSRWNLSTQVNQSLINGADITNLGSDRYAILEPMSPTDRVAILCTIENQDFTLGWQDSGAFSIYEQVAVQRNLRSVSAATGIAMYAMGQTDTAYTGHILQVQRSSDSATAYVLPDLVYRATPLSQLDVGVTLAEWGYGTEVRIIGVLDQSGNGYDAAGSTYWITANGTIASMTSSNNTAMQFQGTEIMQGTLISNYTGTQLNVFALSQIDSPNDTSVLTLYNPANGDDYASALNTVAFQIPPSLTDITTYRNGNLSTQVVSLDNSRRIFATRFDGTNNTLTINGISGTPVASSGAFGFNKILMSARYVSGQTTNGGYLKTACVLVYPNMSSGDFADVQAWMDANF